MYDNKNLEPNKSVFDVLETIANDDQDFEKEWDLYKENFPEILGNLKQYTSSAGFPAVTTIKNVNICYKRRDKEDFQLTYIEPKNRSAKVEFINTFGVEFRKMPDKEAMDFANNNFQNFIEYQFKYAFEQIISSNDPRNKIA